MPFNFEIKDFDKLALAALRSGNCDFEKSRVADRLQACFPNLNIQPARTDSLELRRNLAQRINELYNSNGGVHIPAAVVRALKVDKTASGFKLQDDGSLVATNHPLTDRRLVAIMTAIKLSREDVTLKCEELDARLQVFSQATQDARNSDSSDIFKVHVAKTLSSLVATIRSASEQAVRPETLRNFVGTLNTQLKDLRNIFNTFKIIYSDETREDIRKTLDLALELGNTFGAEVARLKAPVVMVLPVVEPLNLRVVDVQVQNLVKQGPDPAVQKEHHKALVLSSVTNAVGEEVSKLGLNVQELIAFSGDEEKLYEGTDEECQASIEAKTAALTKGIRTVLSADLDDARKVAFLKTVVPADGKVDAAELEAAVKAYRKERYTALAEEQKATLAKDIAKLVLAEIKDNPQCALGLKNLTKDFPMMRNFSKHVKADHKGGALDCFDLCKDGTLEKMLAGNLKAEKARVDEAVDVEKDLTAFQASLKDIVEGTAEALKKRLVTVLSEPLFEDDRTLLTQKALDPAQADTFETDLKAARKFYDDNTLARVMQSMLDVKAEDEKADATSFSVVSAYREMHHIDGDLKVAKYAQDDQDGKVVADRTKLGEQLKQSVRTLFADFFTAKASDERAVHKLLVLNSECLQAMMLDPALIDTIALPDEVDAGLRQTMRNLLEAIKEDVNKGQLSPTDFRAALKTALKGAALKDFTAGLQVAGRQILTGMQAHLKHELMDVLKGLSSMGSNLSINQKTLAELGSSGIGSFDEGYGKFLENVLNNYFTDETLVHDQGRMLESLFRNGTSGETVGEALSALIKGAGPIFQKVLQAIPVDNLPDDIVKALMDVKSGLAPIPESVIKSRLKQAIAENNADKSRMPIKSISIEQSLGAASVAQAIKCRIHYAKKMYDKDVVIKFLRPGVKEIAQREQAFFRKMAHNVGSSMETAFEARMAGIMEEFNFTKEAEWIEKGQCYGHDEYYGKAAHIHSNDRQELYSFEAMNTSKALAQKPDMLTLEVAIGKPLDRCNQEVRDKLEAWERALPGLEAKTGYDLVNAHTELVALYEQMKDQRTLLGELLRRFSAELFARNFNGEGTGGGFMHGDLHGGNLLVSGKTMTVIDFGNSFQLNADERKLLVKFIAACGFSKSSVALRAMDKNVEKRKDYDEIHREVNEILSKGDANDVVARGMAVVQYLQQKNVQVPGAIVNFTETVMRLSAAYSETNAIMDDLAGVIGELKLSPKADRNHDMFAAVADDLFTDHFNMDKLSDFSLPSPNFFLHSYCEDLTDLGTGQKQLTYELYKKSVEPFLQIMRSSRVTYGTTEGESVMACDGIKRIEEKLHHLGEEAFTGSPHAAVLMKELYRIVKSVHDKVQAMVMYPDHWHPDRGDGLNACLSEGLNQLKKTTLIGIVGLQMTGSMYANADDLLEKAEHAVAQHQIAMDAQNQYQHRVGRIPLKTRRFVDRMVREHFLWSNGKPEEIFDSARWFKTDKSLLDITATLKLNRSKLRAGLKAARFEGGEVVENYALLPFAFQHGLAQAVGKLKEADYQKLLTSVTDAETREFLRFLREDPAVVDAMAVGRCAEASEKEVKYEALQENYAYAKAHFRPLGKPVTFSEKTLPTLVKTIVNQYKVLKNHLEKDDDDQADVKAVMEYAMLRYLLDEGFLQALKALPPKAQGDVLDSFIVQKDKTVRTFLTKLLGYM